VAERLVAHAGWARTTFADICREADISNGVLTYSFKDKDDLLLALFERASARWRERLHPTGAGEGEVCEHLAVAIGEATRRGEEQREIFLLLLHYLSQATANPEIATRLRALFAETAANVAEDLARAMARGEIVERDPMQTAHMLQAVIFGLAIGQAALGITVPAAEAAHLVLGYLTTESGVKD
jgi:AcrR family transcriptional regulator